MIRGHDPWKSILEWNNKIPHKSHLREMMIVIIKLKIIFNPKWIF